MIPTYVIRPNPALDLEVRLDHVLNFVPNFRVYASKVDPPGTNNTEKFDTQVFVVSASKLQTGTDFTHAFSVSGIGDGKKATAIAEYFQNGQKLDVIKDGSVLSHVQEDHEHTRLTVFVDVVI